MVTKNSANIVENNSLSQVPLVTISMWWTCLSPKASAVCTELAVRQLTMEFAQPDCLFTRQAFFCGKPCRAAYTLRQSYTAVASQMPKSVLGLQNDSGILIRWYIYTVMHIERSRLGFMWWCWQTSVLQWAPVFFSHCIWTRTCG